MFKIDLHTHSIASPDGGITPSEYQQILADGTLDYVAITDHDTIDFAQKLKAKYGEQIIIGEEISTLEGDIVGLFLTECIAPNQTLIDTAKAIKKQNGLVYIPHPFETVRKGVSKTALESILDFIDIVEVFNGRAVFQNKGPLATAFARINNLPGASSSDAHGAKGLGSAYTIISKKPSPSNLVKQLRTARLTTKRPPLKTLLYPKTNRLKKRLRRG